MDIDTHIDFVVLGYEHGRSGTMLGGVDLNGGLCSLTLQKLDDDAFIINQNGLRQLKDRMHLIHISQRGYFLELCDHQNLSIPSLLTTNGDLRWSFSGPVVVATTEEGFDVKETACSGIALRGQGWIGCLRVVSEVLHLDAYSLQGKSLGPIITGFCPDWNENIDDEDVLLFTIRM